MNILIRNKDKRYSFNLFDLSEVIKMTSDLTSEVKIQNKNFASCISKHKFFGVGNSNLNLIFHFDLSEVIKMTSDLSSEVKIQNRVFCIMHIKTKVFWGEELKNDFSFSF